MRNHADMTQSVIYITFMLVHHFPNLLSQIVSLIAANSCTGREGGGEGVYTYITVGSVEDSLAPQSTGAKQKNGISPTKSE